MESSRDNGTMKRLRIGPGGVAAELGLADPRKAVREDASEQETAQAQAATTRPDNEDVNETWLMPPMALHPLRDRGKHRPGKVRWYHLVTKDGKTQRCHAFTTTRRVWEQVRSGEPLSAKGTVYPDGQPVVPKDSDPTHHPIHCGTCGTHSVLAAELVFLEE
jgi:hypothetical protein